MDRYVGKRLDSRYEILEVIGIGGMAVVYRAHDAIDDRMVAVKILKEEFAGNEDFIRRFKNESKAIAVLSHPNIVKVYDVSFGDRIQYIVEEYIDGITLKEYLDQQKQIKWKEAIHFTVQILRALQHAHEKGIVHRDIKPQNIMLLQDGTIKVTDFGIARFSRSETRTMTDKAIGSVHYIAPEQARGDFTDEKTDLYSVGVMLYEMLTGKLPFEADNAVSVAIMQLQSDPKPPRELNPSLPEGLEEITLKAMQKDPARRYQSAAEMLKDIEEFRRNPSTRFQYKYFVDETPTKYVDAIDTAKNADQSLYNDNYEYVQEADRIPKKRKLSRTTAIILGIAGAFLIAAIGFGIFALTRSLNNSQVQEVSLPDFTGKQYTDVVNDSSYSFTFVKEEKSDASNAAGTIIGQSPNAGTMVKANASITLTVSTGGAVTPMPDLTGKSQADAEKILKNKNLLYTVYPVVNDSVDAGMVVSTDPAAGNDVVEGTTNIKVYVSSGASSEANQVKVPDVSGKSLSDAQAAIESAGLTVGTTTYDDTSTQAADTVIKTDPLNGVKVAKGTSVNILVSSGKGATKTVTVNVDIPKSFTDNVTLQVYIGGQLDSSMGGTYLPSVVKYNVPLKFTGTSGTKDIVVMMSDGKKTAERDYTVDFDSGNYTLVNSVSPSSSSSSSET